MATITELQRLIRLVDEKVAALPEHNWRDDASTRAYRGALAAIFRELEANEGAKTSDGSNGAVLRLGGIRATSTSGELGALQNWKRGAEKRIAQLQGGNDG